MSSIVSSVLHFLVSYRFLLVPVFALPGVALFFVLRKRLGNRAIPVLSVFGTLGIVNLIWGPALNNRYVHVNGVDGSAVVVRVKPTSTRINRVTVMEYEVVLKTADGSTLKTSFLSSDDNVYPEPSGPHQLPPPGQPFTVRYVPGAEHNFIIH